MPETTIPTYLQHDKKWAFEPLGPHTLGSQGCLVTCLAMLSHVTGHRLNPKEMLYLLEENKALLTSGLVYWHGINNVPLLHWVGRYRTVNDPAKVQKVTASSAVERVNRLIGMGFPVCLHVDNVAGDGRPDHWVLLVRGFGETNNVLDPWCGETTFESQYGDPLENLYGWSTIIGPSSMEAPDKPAGLAAYKILEKRYGEALDHLLSP